MIKQFKDSISASVEPARFIGTHRGWMAFESTSIYMSHILRLEKDGKVRFVYDPGRVVRATIS